MFGNSCEKSPYSSKLSFPQAALHEVPVHWEDQQGTKVRLVTDAIDSLRGLLQVRRNRRRGLYRTPSEIVDDLEIWDGPAANDGAEPIPDDRPDASGRHENLHPSEGETP